MKPSLAKGTRDFNSEQIANRNFIIETARKLFTRYGFQPIETPAMENLSTLTGKYGEEGDQLLFKILKNGDFLTEAKDFDNYKKLAFQITEKGLRYDLTVPFARFVSMNRNDIKFPFKRYQIQPVWRGDKPQKGRYQEFYQCDVDVVGSDSLLYEAELIEIYDQVFAELSLPVVIKINSRKILTGIAKAAGIAEKMVEMTVCIDKLDKIGEDGVRKEMQARGIPEASIELIFKILAIQAIEELNPFFENNPEGQEGIREVQTVLRFLKNYPLQNELKIDFTLARGLSYYTGLIFEVAAKNVKMGSIGGGGRYDNLTAMFGFPNVSGVGVSFGIERIYDVMTELNLFPQENTEALKALVIAFDEETHLYAFDVLRTLRKAGINADLYPKPTKIKKQMDYANDRKLPFVVLIGETEMQTGELSLKNMQTGEQMRLSVEELILKLS